MQDRSNSTNFADNLREKIDNSYEFFAYVILACNITQIVYH